MERTRLEKACLALMRPTQEGYMDADMSSSQEFHRAIKECKALARDVVKAVDEVEAARDAEVAATMLLTRASRMASGNDLEGLKEKKEGDS